MSPDDSPYSRSTTISFEPTLASLLPIGRTEPTTHVAESVYVLAEVAPPGSPLSTRRTPMTSVNVVTNAGSHAATEAANAAATC